MAFNPNNYLVIGTDIYQNTDSYYIHERETNKDGTPGKIVTFADGKGDVRNVARSYVEKGFDPNKIIINGQPSKDVFQKSGEDSMNSSKEEKLKNIGKAGLLYVNPLAYIALTMNNPDFALKLPNSEVG